MIRDSKLIPDPNPPVGFYDFLGFSYDPSVDDYKILRIVSDDLLTVERSQIDIYALKTNSWKTVRHTPFGIKGPRSCKQGCAVNGYIYCKVNKS